MIYIFIFCLLFYGLISSAKKVYQVKYDSQVDVKIFPVTYELLCDLKVFWVNNKSQVKKDGLCFPVEYDSQADIKIYFVEYENQADLKIYFVKYENQAGWNKKAKQYLMY